MSLRPICRRLARQPGYSFMYLASLALGIGAATAVFSVVYGVLLRPLPYADADRIVAIWDDTGQFGLTPAEFVTIRHGHRSLDGVAAFSTGLLTLSDASGPAERIGFASVTTDFLAVLGSGPASGRGFLADEQRPDGAAVAIVSDRLWARRYQREPAIVGREIRINGFSFTVVGVMPGAFAFPDSGTDIWLPAQLDESALSAGNRYLRSIARLAPGVDLTRASSDLQRVNATYRNARADAGLVTNATASLRLRPIRDELAGAAGRPLWLLLAGVGLLLLIACANVAHLVASRTSARSAELAVRAALGASRLRLLAELLSENLLLATAGGLAGIGLAAGGVALAQAAGGSMLPLSETVRLDAVVLASALLVTAATGVLFGIAAGWQLAATDRPAAAGTGWFQGDGPPASTRLRRALVAGEVAVALTLLVAAGLLSHSVTQMLDVDLGFVPDGAITMELSAPSGSYPAEAVGPFYGEVARRVATDLGMVTVAGLTSALPFGGTNPNTSLEVEGRSTAPDEPDVAQYRIVTPGYFASLGIPLQRGRVVSEMDTAGSALVALVNEVAAARYWPGADPIGRRLRLTSESPWLEVVGVVGAVRHTGFGAAQPELYLARAQPDAASGLGTWRTMSLVVRVNGSTGVAVSGIRELLAAIDPAIPVSRIRTMEAVVGDTIAVPRLAAGLVGLFAAASLLLVGVGIYGVLAHFVDGRRRELALRQALGADAATTVRFVLSRVIPPVAAGAAFGVAGGLIASRSLRGLLFDAAGSPLEAIVVATAVLAAVAVAAVFGPVRRALSANACQALKE